MKLVNSDTGREIATEKDGVLDEAYSEDGTLSEGNDFISYIEVKDLSPGPYELHIMIPKLLFQDNSEWPSCLSFNFIAEYLVHDANSATYESGIDADGL